MPLKIQRGEHRIVSHDGVRAPRLFQLANGDLLLTYHMHADIHFPRRECLRSRDNGATWQKEPQRVYKEMAWGDDGNGTVLAFERDTFEQREGVYLGAYYRSEDGGETFTGPHECALHIDGVASRGYPPSEAHYPEPEHPQHKFYCPLPAFYKPIVERSSLRRGMMFWRYMHKADGLWLATMQGPFYGDTGQRSILVTSDDDGATWRYLSTISYEYNKLVDGNCEPVMRRVADGSLLCMMRRGGKQPMAQCRSTDGGRTWSDAELQISHGVDPDLCLLSNGVLACTYGRPGKWIMLSEDGSGHAWGYHTEIAGGRSSGMMGMAEVAPGRLLIVYDDVIDDAPEAGRDADKCRIFATTIDVAATAR